MKDELSRALDLYHKETSVPIVDVESKEDPFVIFKKILPSSNLTLDPGASYLFCPNALQVQASLFPGRPALAAHLNTTELQAIQATSETKSEAVDDPKTKRSKRLRKAAGLDEDDNTIRKRAKTTESEATRAEPNITTVTKSKLLLWVPSESLAGLSDIVSEYPSSKRPSGLTEVSCEVASIRPLLL